MRKQEMELDPAEEAAATAAISRLWSSFSLMKERIKWLKEPRAESFQEGCDGCNSSIRNCMTGLVQTIADLQPAIDAGFSCVVVGDEGGLRATIRLNQGGREVWDHCVSMVGNHPEG